MDDFYLFHDVDIPNTFRFPKIYLELLKDGFPNIKPWWFVAEEQDKANLFFEIIQYVQSSNKLLIPFAKLDDSTGDIACFDGEDLTGDPKIYFVCGGEKDMSSIDWSKRYYRANFKVWYEEALEDHKKFYLY